MTLEQATKIVELFADKYTRGDFDEALNQMDMARDCLTMKERAAFYAVKEEKSKV